MSENRILSVPAEAGSGIEVDNLRMALMDCIEVLEMPVLKNSVRMEIGALETFCKRSQPNLPIFSLKVEERTQGVISFPVQHPYRKYFTLSGEWCFYAVEPIAQKNTAVKMEGGELLVA